MGTSAQLLCWSPGSVWCSAWPPSAAAVAQSVLAFPSSLEMGMPASHACHLFQKVFGGCRWLHSPVSHAAPAFFFFFFFLFFFFFFFFFRCSNHSGGHGVTVGVRAVPQVMSSALPTSAAAAGALCQGCWPP